jgi:hypothetical protein
LTLFNTASPSSEGETRSCTFCHGQTRDAIDGRGDTPPRAETSAPASLLRREKDRKRGWRRPVRWCGDMQGIDGRYTCRRRGGSLQLSLPLGLPPLRERRGLARSAGERVARYSPPAGPCGAGNDRSDVRMRRPAVLPPHGRGRDARRRLPGRGPRISRSVWEGAPLARENQHTRALSSTDEPPTGSSEGASGDHR